MPVGLSPESSSINIVRQYGLSQERVRSRWAGQQAARRFLGNPGGDVIPAPQFFTIGDTGTIAELQSLLALLTSVDIAVTSYSALVLAEPSLQRYYRLGDSAGSGTAVDSDSGQNGTVQSGVTLGVTGLLTGDTDKAASFDGTANAHIDIPSPAIGSGSWSIVAVYNPTNLGGSVGAHDYSTVVGFTATSRLLARNGTTSSATDYGLLAQFGGISLTIPNTNGGAGPLPVLVVVVYDDAAGTLTGYVNGSAVAGPTTVASAPLLNVAGWIGAFTSAFDNYMYAGVIDEVSIHASALSASFIASLNNAWQAVTQGNVSESATVQQRFTSSDSGTDAESTSITSPVSASDTATATEVATLVAQITATDVNSVVTEAISVLTAILSSLDAGSGSEASTLAAKPSSTDTGTDTEVAAIALTATDASGATGETVGLTAALGTTDASGASTETAGIRLATSDSGTIAETATETAAITATEVGTETENTIKAFSTVDTATDTETATPVVVMSATDSGTDSEVGAIIIVATDAGSDSETATQVVQIPAADTATDIEVATPTVRTTTADTASDSETATPVAQISTADVATDTEVAIETVAISTGDTATDAESGSISNVPKNDSDTGTVTDTPIVKAAISTLDTATDSEAQSLAAKPTSTDAGTDSEAATLQTAISAADTGSDLESALLAALLSSADTASASEAQTLSVKITVTDGSTGVDIAALQTTISSADAAIAVAAQTLAINVIIGDSGSDIETVSFNARIIAGDSAASSEDFDIVAILSAPDAATAVEVAVARVVKQLAQISTGSLSQSETGSPMAPVSGERTDRVATLRVRGASTGTIQSQPLTGKVTEEDL